MTFKLAEYLKMAVILIGGLLFIWAFMIQPNNVTWERSSAAQGIVKTLMSNSNVIGSPVINAVVILETGQQVIVPVPMRADIRAGDPVDLFVQVDAKKQTRKRYTYKGAAP